MNLLLKRETNYPALEKVFLTAWTVYSVYFLYLTISELPFVFPVLQGGNSLLFYPALAVLALAFVFVGKMPWKKFAALAAFMALVAAIELQHINGTFLIMAMFMVAAQFVDMRRFMRYDMLLKLGMLLSILLLYAAGVLPESGFENKHALGFTHPNLSTVLPLTILAQWLCLRFHKMRAWEWAAVFLLFAGVLFVCGGRTTAYTFLLIYVLFLAAKRYPKVIYSKTSKAAFVVATPLMAAASYITGILYRQGSAWMDALNRWLSTRPYWIDRFLRDYDIRLFGQEVVVRGDRTAALTGLEILSLDNAYIRLLLERGVVYFAVFCVVYSLVFYKLLERKKAEWALFALFFIIVGFGENYMSMIFFNISLLYFLGTDNIPPEPDTAP